eukprot:TRINITY_DN1674_c1_g1_i1.p1 TRINITY_DN1674_c1_g1~~TRINITY_DN1674_c1_g1_i1.p1  ORF type:complete len:381 (-),score=74.39 TRINITY_DN1674_c1_g1_i1:333-1475(-)
MEMDDCQQQPFEDHQQRLQRIPVDFGQAWQIQLHTLKGAAFHYATRASISKDHDFTGLRVYSGTQALGLFLLKHPEFVTDRRVIELGCGTGALGQLLVQRLRCKRLVLTDGESQALVLAKMNTSHANTDCCGEPVAVQQLRWGDAKETAGALAQGAFDVCLGADLMYYNIDVRLLLTTALSLVAARSACICGGSNTCSPHSITTCSNAGHDHSNSARPGSSDSFADGATSIAGGSSSSCTTGTGDNSTASGDNNHSSESGRGTRCGCCAGGGGDGVVLFAHIFRCQNMQQELVELCGELGVTALEVPLEGFSSEGDRDLISHAFNIKLIVMYRSDAAVPFAVQQLLDQELAAPLRSRDCDVPSSDEDEQFASNIEDDLFA